MSNKDIYELLKKQLPAHAVKPHPTKNYLSTIKPIAVFDRLNEVFGLGGWDYTVNKFWLENDYAIVHITFTVADVGIRRESFGGNNNTDPGDAYKGALSDAISKAASMIGVGFDVYSGLSDAPAGAPPPKKPAQKRKSDDLPWLDDEKHAAMIKAIGDGQGQTVRERMEHYKINKKHYAALMEAFKAAKQ